MLQRVDMTDTRRLNHLIAELVELGAVLVILLRKHRIGVPPVIKKVVEQQTGTIDIGGLAVVELTDALGEIADGGFGVAEGDEGDGVAVDGGVDL